MNRWADAPLLDGVGEAGAALGWRRGWVSDLAADEVFVFGSNGSGFHGAGSAGVAWRGSAGGRPGSPEHWKADAAFMRALGSPVGSAERVGRWAVLGVAQGPQVGREGKSYAVQTVVRPGARRSVPLSLPGGPVRGGVWEPLPDLLSQAARLSVFAAARPALTFLVCPPGLCGYSLEEVSGVWVQVPRPGNLVFVSGS